MHKAAASDEQAGDLIELREPRAGVPPVIDSPAALDELIERVGAGSGPVAVDAERASGYRYGQRAFLIQLHREDIGTALIDPEALGDLAALGRALGESTWVLHAANQDLPCLRDAGLVPGGELFDTELAARLAGLERVGLAAVVEQLLGLRLAKEHSAADWSTRPLPQDWLVYAALDVEVLLEVADELTRMLQAAGKTEWAQQEFRAIRDAEPLPQRADPWRRTSGMHALRKPRQLAALRELWLTRDQIARGRDIAPGRIVPDKALVNAASTLPGTREELLALPVFGGRSTRKQVDHWFAALERAATLPPAQLPPQSLPGGGPPPVRAWKEKAPDAAERLTRARAALGEHAAAVNLPLENLLQPDVLRRVAWAPPQPLDAASLDAALAERGARPWQREQTVPLILASWDEQSD